VRGSLPAVGVVPIEYKLVKVSHNENEIGLIFEKRGGQHGGGRAVRPGVEQTAMVVVGRSDPA
jgi:hypothetical protein